MRNLVCRCPETHQPVSLQLYTDYVTLARIWSNSVRFQCPQPAAGHTAASELIRLERERRSPGRLPTFRLGLLFLRRHGSAPRPAAHRPAAVGEPRHYASIIHATIPISATTTAAIRAIIARRRRRSSNSRNSPSKYIRPAAKEFRELEER